MMNKLKKIAYLVLIGIFFLTGYFYKSVLSLFYQHSIQAYFTSNFDCHLHYDNAYFEGNRFIIESPSLDCKNGFNAKKMSFDWSFNLRRREIGITVELDHPSWIIDSNQTFNKEKLEEAFPRRKGGLNYFLDLTVHHGIATWLLSDNSKNQIFFDAKANNYSDGFIKLFTDETNNSSQFLSILISVKQELLTFSFDCRQLECARLFPMFKLFFPSLDKIRMSSGIFNGLVKAYFPSSQRPYLEGELFIDNVAFSYANSLNGKFEKAKVSIEKNSVLDQPLTTLATIDLIKPISLIFSDKKDIHWEINQLIGNIHLDRYKKMAIQLKCLAKYGHHLNQFELFGKVNLNAKEAFHVDLNLLCSKEDEIKSQIKLNVQQFDKQKKAEIAFDHLTRVELGFLQNFVSSFWPSFKRIDILQGTFNGLIGIELTKEGMQEINVKHLKASDVHFNHLTLQTSGKFDALWGNGVMRLSNLNAKDNLDLEFHLRNGCIEFKNHLVQNLPFTDIQADLRVKKGAVEHSLITLNWMGLNGTMDLEWGKSKELLSIKLEGLVSHLVDVLPDKIKRGLNQTFPHSKLKISTDFRRKNQKIELNGLLNVQRDQTEEYDLIHFGCDFFKISSSTQKWSPLGWFYASNVPLEKFVSPFVFRNGVLNMTGQGEFRGTFDLHKLIFYYNVRDLKLENNDLLIKVKDLGSEVPGKMRGFHQINLHSFSHHGFLPVSKASYEEKNTGLSFTNIDGTLHFKDDTLEIQPLEASCEGVNLNSQIFLNYEDPAPGVFSLILNVPHASGRISQFQSILSHLKNTTLFTNLPMEGEISMRDQGMNLKFDFIPKDYQLEADIQASLTDGSISLKEMDLALKGLFFDMDYHHDKECLELSEIQGSLLLGKPSNVEEYQFGGDFIRLHDLIVQDVDCDLWVKNQTKELLRFKASTKKMKSGLKKIILSPQSHFSCIYPSSFSCQMKNWSDFSPFSFTSHFKLNDFVNDLLLFKKTGLHCLSQSFLNKLSALCPITGRVNCHIFLDEKTGKLNYELEGEKLTFNHSIEHYFQLATHQTDQKWVVDTFKWDDFNAQAEISCEGDLVKIPFLGLKQKETLLLGLNGELDFEQSNFTGKIHLCEICLEGISKWPKLNSFAKKWLPKGIMRGTGNIKIEWLLKEPWYQYSLFLEAAMPTFSCRDQFFYPVKPIQVHYKSDRALTIENIHLNLLQTNENASHISIKQIDYKISQDQLMCPQLAFQIPTAHLFKIGQSFHCHFPEWVDTSVKDFFVHLKKEGELKGELGFEINDSTSQFSLKLNDGIYTFHEQNYFLKNFELNQIKHLLYFSATSQKEKCPFQIKGKVNWPHLNAGEVVLKDFLVDSETPPLKIQFSKDSENTFIQYAKGYFCGMDFDLKPGVHDLLTPQISRLQGKVDIELNQLTNLFTASTAENIQQLKLGSVFTLQGNYGYHYQSNEEFTNSFYFQGNLTSQNAFFKGFRFDKISAHLNYHPKNLEITSFLVEDLAGKIQADHIFLTQHGYPHSWLFAIPSLSIKNFKPALLRNSNQVTSNRSTRFKTLLVKRVEVKNINGELTESKTWEGKGELHFLNSSRKNQTHPLLTIPAEIILRLGLNPQVLNPVTGAVLFDIKEDRLYFTRFKDVYSEGRGSKFYLAQTPTPSWMDMQGNLSVRIRMKQYNLLFKLAELFTVSMEGSINKPIFSLQKQRNVRKIAKFLRPYEMENKLIAPVESHLN